MKNIITKELKNFNEVNDLFNFLYYNKGKSYFKHIDGSYEPVSATFDPNHKRMVMCGNLEITEGNIVNVDCFADPEKPRSEVKKGVDGHNYLILPDNTCVSILLTREIPVYWVANKIVLVEDAQTIYGGSPHNFGIRID